MEKVVFVLDRNSNSSTHTHTLSLKDRKSIFSERDFESLHLGETKTTRNETILNRKVDSEKLLHLPNFVNFCKKKRKSSNLNPVVAFKPSSVVVDDGF